MSTGSKNIKVITDGLIFSTDAFNGLSYVSGNSVCSDMVETINDGSLLNGVGFDTNAWVFDGTNDRIDFTDVDGVSNLSTWTFEIWAKGDVGASGNWYIGLLGNTGGDDTTVSFGIIWRHESNWIDARSSNGSAAKAARYSTNPSLGVWHQFVNTYDGSDLRLWVDGVNVATLNETFTPYTSSNVLQYGASTLAGTNLRPFNGNISNVKLYNRPFSESEIKQNYGALKYRFI
jgi:hypothetical protein